MGIEINYPLKHKELEAIWFDSLPMAREKGYPAAFNEMLYWVLLIDGQAIAYTGSLILSNKRFAFVRNTYVRKEWRSKGLHKYLLNHRNNVNVR